MGGTRVIVPKNLFKPEMDIYIFIFKKRKKLMQRLPWRQLLYEAEQAGKKAALSPNVSIDSQAPLRTRCLSERKWRSVDVLQYGSFSLSGVPPQRVAKRNWLAMT